MRRDEMQMGLINHTFKAVKLARAKRNQQQLDACLTN